jgi:hypothetical protein
MHESYVNVNEITIYKATFDYLKVFGQLQKKTNYLQFTKNSILYLRVKIADVDI